MRRALTVLLTVVLLLSIFTACGKKAEDPADSDKKPAADVAVTSLAEAQAAIAEGHYEAAYLYLLTDSSDEAVELRKKFSYVPVEVTVSKKGEVLATGRWTYDEKGYPLLQVTDADYPGNPTKGSKVEYTYDDKGNPLTETFIKLTQDKETRTEYVYAYDADGNVLTMDRTDSDGNWAKRVCTYDADGNCLTEKLTGEGFIQYERVYTYNAAGQMLTCDYTSADRGWTKEVCTYDAAGNRLTYEHTSSSGDWWKEICTYADGRQVSYERSDFKESWEKWYMDGTKKVSENRQGSDSYSKKIEEGNVLVYEYSLSYGDETDIHGNVIEKGSWREDEKGYDTNGNELYSYWWTGYHPDVLLGTSQGRGTRYTYDDKGNCLKVEDFIYSDPDDPEGSKAESWVSLTYTYVYDADGRIAEQEKRNSDGDVVTTVFTYDSLGRKATEKERFADGGWYRWTYRYRDDEDISGDDTREYRYDNGDYCICTFDDNGNMLTREESKDGKITKTECTYNDLGKVLTQKDARSDGYWTNLVNTFDAYGHQLSREHSESDGTWRKETFDAAGNDLSFEGKDDYKILYKWELRYYPDGISDALRSDLSDFCHAATCFEMGVYDYTGIIG